MPRVADTRSGTGARLGVVLCALLAGRGTAVAGAREMLVATRDPALLSALAAAFSPRGVRVVASAQPLHATSDDLTDRERAADLVWLCDLPPSNQETALCVRPQRGPVIVRRIAMATPLSAEDAAALALSVQVALMPEAIPPARPTTSGADVTARASALPAPSPAARPAERGAHALTLELAGGARNAPGGPTLRAGVAAVYAPRRLAHRLGLGAAIAGGPTYGAAAGAGRGPGPPLPTGDAADLTLRLFARGQAHLGPIWLQLDLGPAVDIVTRSFAETNRSSEQRAHWSVDSFLGAVIPFGRFFGGARVGGSYLLTGNLAATNPTGGSWSGEALGTLGVGWF